MNEKTNNLILDFIEQLEGKKQPTALQIADAWKASEDSLDPDLSDFVMEFAKQHDISENDPQLLQVKEASTAGLAAAQEKRQMGEALKISTDIAQENKEFQKILKTNSTNSDITKEKKQTLVNLVSKLQTIKSTTSNIATWDDYVEDIKNFDSNQHFKAKLFDDIVFPSGTVSYIGARTGRGKTTALVNLAREAINKKTRKTLFISLEMSRKDIINKLILSKICELSLEKNFTLDRESPCEDLYQLMKGTAIKKSKYSKQFIECATEAQELVKYTIDNGIFVLLDGRGVTFNDIINTITTNTKAINGHAPLVLLDYIQKMPVNLEYSTKEELQRIANASSELIKASIGTNAVTIASAQFNRSSGKESDGADILSDTGFRGCGDLEQDAENAIGIGWDSDNQDRRFFEVLKYRQGQSGGKYDIIFDGQYSYMAKGKKNDLTIRTKTLYDSSSKKTKDHHDSDHNHIYKEFL
ncbi:hypothetical protein AGMMS49593_02260 [Endomicrobiia bacterium]|nr:hypothetical protein AGMMS49593_02260 [Endomicrobiia bacterium]